MAHVISKGDWLLYLIVSILGYVILTSRLMVSIMDAPIKLIFLLMNLVIFNIIMAT